MYYGRSHAYAVILGLIQLAGGALLLFRKTALLGAALTLTNILMINVFFLIAWGAMCTSTFIFASMLAVLWHHRHALVGVFWTDQASEPASVRRYHRNIAALVVLVITLMGFALRGSAPADNEFRMPASAPRSQECPVLRRAVGSADGHDLIRN